MVLYDERRKGGARGSLLTEQGHTVIRIFHVFFLISLFRRYLVVFLTAWRSGWDGKFAARFSCFYALLCLILRGLSFSLRLAWCPVAFLAPLLDFLEFTILPANTPISCLIFFPLATHEVSQCLRLLSVFSGCEIIASEVVS